MSECYIPGSLDPSCSLNHRCFRIGQARLVRGTFAVHETLSEYKTVEELWDGEI